MPEFARSDPALPEFWEMRYRAAFTPWDAGAVPARLREHVARHRPAGRVLVPGCGSGHDVRYLAEAGLDVQGIDFSPAALAAALPVLGPFADRVREADFFGPGLEGPWSLVYERAFLCSLPRRLWTNWAARVAQLAAPGGLLAGFFYFDEGQRGPPFPLHGQAELDGLLAEHFDRVEDLPVEDSVEVFAGKERWQAWARK
ncbi:MAG TPA: methyltransferase domain-containing protein [Usitatibacteraceae bacterium]|nr:methyltransferase domain-containing protein [Usitatibacteraceae bacterium]